MNKEKMNKFSVPLGLLDFVNPIFYSATMIIIISCLYSALGLPYNVILLVGAVISIVFGLAIPTGKVLVGLGVMKFRMPVPLVFSVNSGIYLSGLMLLKYAFSFPWFYLLIISAFVIVFLVLVYLQSKKINSVAVLTGAFGYLMIYISLIFLSVNKSCVFPIILYAFAICLFVMLIGIGIKADLKNPKVHWVIEISNVTCQFFVMMGTIILFLL